MAYLERPDSGNVPREQWACWGSGLMDWGGKPCPYLQHQLVTLDGNRKPLSCSLPGNSWLGLPGAGGGSSELHDCLILFQVQVGRTRRPQTSTDILRQTEVSAEVYIFIQQTLIECPLGAWCWEFPSCLYNLVSWGLFRCPLYS